MQITGKDHVRHTSSLVKATYINAVIAHFQSSTTAWQVHDGPKSQRHQAIETQPLVGPRVLGLRV